jgi:hypothetical protein
MQGGQGLLGGLWVFVGLQVLLDEVILAVLVFLFANQLSVFGLFDPGVACYVDGCC